MLALTDVSWEQRVLHASAVELTAAAAVGLLLEEAKLRGVSWIANSTYALDVTTQRCRVKANTAFANFARGAWSAVRRLSRVETFHVRSCGEVEDVVGALTPTVGGVAQVFHDLLVAPAAARR